MAKKDSVQSRLGKVRPPRVHLTYDVQVGDAIEKKELPFVVGVLGEFSGQPDADKPLPKLKDRKFVAVDLDNFDDVMSGMSPKSSYRVKNKLSADGGEFAALAYDRVDRKARDAGHRRLRPQAQRSSRIHRPSSIGALSMKELRRLLIGVVSAATWGASSASSR